MPHEPKDVETTLGEQTIAGDWKWRWRHCRNETAHSE